MINLKKKTQIKKTQIEHKTFSFRSIWKKNQRQKENNAVNHSSITQLNQLIYQYFMLCPGTRDCDQIVPGPALLAQKSIYALTFRSQS